MNSAEILKITIMTRSSQKGKGSEGKGERNSLDWTQNTRYTDWVIKWVIVRIAAFWWWWWVVLSDYQDSLDLIEGF